MRRRGPALGLVFALLCALTLVVPAPAAAVAPATHVGHFGKKVVVTSFDQHGPSLRLDQPVTTQPHPPRSGDDGVVAGNAAAPADPLAPFATSLHTRGPPAGR
jgi:hypothetical protein